MNFKDIDLLKFGHEIQIAGMVLDSDSGTMFAMFPDELEPRMPIRELDMTLEDWERFLYQSDVLETITGGPEKAIVRKSHRQIDQNVAWAVFRRDDYTCQYCGRGNVPLTVDHIVLWEEGGPTIQENLITACRPCNRKRGRMPFAQWVVEKGLTGEYINNILKSLPDLERLKVQKQRSR